MRVGSTTRVTVHGFATLTSALRKRKTLASAVSWNGAAALTGALGKRKRLTSATEYTQHPALTSAIGKHKALSSAVTWNGSADIASALGKTKALSSVAQWNGTAVIASALGKHKALSSTLQYIDARALVGAVAKQKSLSSVVQYPVSGARYAGAANDMPVIGGTAWTNPGNATGAPDGNYADCVLPVTTDVTDILILADYGFAVPGGATIDGITVVVTLYNANSGENVIDITAQLANSGVPFSSNKATGSNLPTAPSTTTYGGPADLWGAVLTPAVANSNAFGVILQYQDNGGGTLGEPKVDAVQITVSYH